MSFFGVPWMIGGGQAQHSADLGRIVANAAFGGVEGVVDPLDLRVLPLPTPGGAVQGMPGTCAVLNRSVGGSGQMYVNRNTAAETISISPTTSSGPRSDLVVAQVMDPFAAGEGWTAPADPVNGPYMAFRVIEGVPANTTSVAQTGLVTSAIALARIDLPSSTGTVQAGHIKDLRQIAGTSERLSDAADLAEAIAVREWSGVKSGVSSLLPGQTTYTDWPSQANWRVPIPAWASSADFVVMFNPELNNHVWGDMQVHLGSQIREIVNAFDINKANDAVGGAERSVILLAGSIDTSSMRGTVQTLKLRARTKDPATHPGQLDAGQGCFVVASLTFKGHPALS